MRLTRCDQARGLFFLLLRDCDLILFEAVMAAAGESRVLGVHIVLGDDSARRRKRRMRSQVDRFYVKRGA
jgi:hypothetical protein